MGAVNGVLLHDAVTIVNIGIPKLRMDVRDVASLLLNFFPCNVYTVRVSLQPQLLQGFP